MGKKSVGLLVATLVVVAGIAGLKFYYPSSLETAEVAVPKLPPELPAAANVPPEVAKLNALQEEIGKLSEEEIAKQVEDLKTKLKADNLLVRVNSNRVEGEEKERAKEMLVRLSLLGVEQRKRGQKNLEAQNNKPLED